MRIFTPRSRTTLFFTELLLSLLFFSLSACVCIQIFSTAETKRKEAREWNHIQEAEVIAGEFLSGSFGTAVEFLELYPSGEKNENSLLYYYDLNWKETDPASASYCMRYDFSQNIRCKTIVFSCYRKETLFYQQKISFPIFRTRKEAIGT